MNEGASPRDYRMERKELKDLLQAVAEGVKTPDEALSKISLEPFEELGFATLDTHRGVRQGVSEVVYGLGKTAHQIIDITKALLAAGQERVLITRVDTAKAEKLFNALEPQSVESFYSDQARLALIGGFPTVSSKGYIAVVSAGTSDESVAEEAALTAEALGNEVLRLYDLGVAGIHRLLAHADELMNARVVIAIAGMEGALPSVVGGLVSCPVIAVPTSVGYGASLNGLAALMAMLNSCASGISVVNIDNGFGAAYQASLINHLS